MRIITLLSSLYGIGHAQSGGETISIAAPSLSEEEQYSVVIPQQYKCEGCYAVASQIFNAVLRQRGLFSKRVVEDDAFDVLDSACDEKNFQTYGLSLVNGKNKLTGPGIPTEHTEPSPGGGFITMSGGLWPKRLTSRCTELVSETEETQLVKLAIGLPENGEKFANHVCKKLVRDCKGRRMAKTTNTTLPAEPVVGGTDETIRVDHTVPHAQRMSSHDEF